MDDDDDGGDSAQSPTLEVLDTDPMSPIPPGSQLVGLDIEVLEDPLLFSPNKTGGLDVNPLLPKISPLPEPSTQLKEKCTRIHQLDLG